ncbi:hypothetical protein MMC12_005701 [Toensbergia leucococca]|nr:hypothetical protein [Toensbergia leucococca]
MIKAVISGYPTLDFQSPWFNQAFMKPMYGRPTVPISILESHLAAMSPNDIVSSADLPARVPIMMATVQHGKYTEILGTDDSLFPMKAIESAKEFPPLFYIMGSPGATRGDFADKDRER